MKLKLIVQTKNIKQLESKNKCLSDQNEIVLEMMLLGNFMDKEEPKDKELDYKNFKKTNESLIKKQKINEELREKCKNIL